MSGWSKRPIPYTRGNSHLRFETQGDTLRLTTNMPLTYLCEEQSFALHETVHLALTWGTPIEDDLEQVCSSFLEKTAQYWRLWVKHCSIPPQFQTETIRSALALKLHCFEDTGAILAALTTSLPEEHGKNRNWDYRFCWLRDAHFVLSALHNLGQFEEMEGFLKFLLGIAGRLEPSGDSLAPVYTLSQQLPLPEHEHTNWGGHAASLPVRTNNQAAEHVQNDVYGEMVLTLAPIFFDERFLHLRNREHEELLMRLARLCERSISTPDAGLWEVRNHWQEHTFTNLMSWAGLERASRIRPSEKFLVDARERAIRAIEAAQHEGALRNGPADQSFDAALSLAGVLRLPRNDLILNTVRAIQSDLALGEQRPLSSFFYRYRRKDDFGKPHSAFLICSFWVAQALARLGFTEEARAIVEDAASAGNHLGLFSEHYLPDSNLQLGNFPQAYSHVGLINAAFAVSPPWSEVL